MYLNILLVIFSSTLLFHRTEGTCPAYDVIKPCTCSSLTDKDGEEFSTITCKALNSEKSLESVLSTIKGTEVFEFRIQDSSFRYIPNSAFEGTTIQVISFSNSSIAALSDSDVAFKGLENHLHVIEIINCTFVNSWDWSQLLHLKYMMEIDIKGSDIMDITDGISKIQHLHIEGFLFQKNQIEWLDDHVFSSFVNLVYLYLDDNSLNTLKRSMFPRPAKLLQVLSLSYNKLTSLPADIFADMPSLTSLYLTGNQLRTIEEPTFKPIWNQLRLFFFYDTSLSCDCRLNWLTKTNNDGKFIHAVCHTPSLLKGKLLTSLKEGDIWC